MVKIYYYGVEVHCMDDALFSSLSNSNFGRLRFEVANEAGVFWLSCSRDGWGVCCLSSLVRQFIIRVYYVLG